MTDNGRSQGAVPAARWRCFVVSAFGSSAEEQRRHKQVLHHLVQRVLDDRYVVVRADQIDEEGLITNQIIEHLLEDELVVADLTGLNPNVFYEVAVRHAARKPIVHLISRGQDIPFDLANMRIVPYALDDPDMLEEAQADLDRKVKAIEACDFQAAPNPVSAARDVWLLRSSEQPEVRETASLLAGFNQLQDEVRSLARRIDPRPGRHRLPSGLVPSSALVKVFDLVRQSQEPLDETQLVMLAGFSRDGVSQVLKILSDQGRIYRREDGRWSPQPSLPF